jgi:POT family proton-dependent oligopeptide transporter
MTVADATPDYEVGPADDRAFLGHPKGLGYLGFTEACERFSYYSMQTLLVLYMVNYLLKPGRMEHVIGLNWVQANIYHGIAGQPLASAIFGTYTALVYGTPILGGIVADKWLGRDTTLIIGGVLMAIGHFLMAIQSAFVFALLALVLGVGAFKGNIATQVGALYGPNDLRRAMAFQIFYIFINVSVIVAPLISGTLGQKVGWHYGFGCAGVVMVIGLVIYLTGRRYLPAEERAAPSEEPALRQPLSRDDWMCVIYLIILIPVLAIALLTNQQIFNAYLTWGDQQFDLSLLNNTSSWLITVDAAVSFTMLVAVAAFWKWWGTHHREPDEISKMISTNMRPRPCSAKGRSMHRSCSSASSRATRRISRGGRSSGPPAPCSTQRSKRRASTARRSTSPMPSSTSSSWPRASGVSTTSRTPGRSPPAAGGSSTSAS